MIALLILVGTLALLLVVRASLPGTSSVVLFSPVGLFVVYLAIAVGTVPLLWAIGWARPWSEIAYDPYAAALTTCIALTATAAGIVIAFPIGAVPKTDLQTPPRNLEAALVSGLAIGVGGYLLLAVSAGGPLALLYSLADRRDLLSGSGPLRAILVVSAIACVYGVLHTGKSRRQRCLTWACGLSYVGSTLLTGSRFQVIVLFVAVSCAYVRVHGLSRRLGTVLLVATVAVVPLSTIYGLRVRTGLTYGQDVSLADASTVTVTTEALVGPFVRGGLDTIRTTGVATLDLPLLRFDLDLLLGSVANVIPRSLWPSKPDGAATQFSREYFPSKWAEGTGIPPSIFAEALHSFGSGGGLVALLLLGLVLTRLSYWMMSRPRLFWVLLAPFFAADCIQLAKGGSDGFLRTVTLQLVAVVVMVLIARLARTTMQVSEGIVDVAESRRTVDGPLSAPSGPTRRTSVAGPTGPARQ